MRKFRELFLLSVSLCLFAFSCTLETAEDGTGSVSITLPGNQVNSRAVSLDETPTKYYIALFYGNDATTGNSEGKVREQSGKAGEVIKFTKLKPGPYTLYVRGDAPFCYYEEHKNITVKPGLNPESIKLANKVMKAQLIIDLSDLESLTTYNISITNINGEKVYEDKTLDISSLQNKQLFVPYGFMQGKYSINFTSLLSNEERYYVNGGNTFEVGYSSSPITINKTITSRPIKSFIVDAQATSEGDGTLNSPFKSLNYAIDKAISSTDTIHEDINIIVKRSVIENDTILINNNVNISIVGEQTAVVIGNFIIDNATLSVENITIKNPNSENIHDVKKDSFTLKNRASLLINSNVIIENGFLLSGESIITIGNVSDVSAIISTIKLESYEENKKIIDTLNPSTVITDIPLAEDSRFEVNQEGVVIKKRENATIKLNIDPIKEGRSIEVKYYKESTPEKYIFEVLKSNNQELLNPLTIGDVYVFELVEKTRGETQTIVPVGRNRIVISSNPIQNEVLLNYVLENYNYYVDSINGNDRINSGISSNSPFETIERAIDEISYKAELFNSNPYRISLNGEFVGKDSIIISDISNIELLVNGVDNHVNIKNPLIVNNSHITLSDIEVDKVELSSSVLSLTGESTLSNTCINNIYLNGSSSIKVCKDFNGLEKPMNIFLEPSLYSEGTKVLDLSLITSSKETIVNYFKLDNNYWKINNEGNITTNSNVTINLDITPEDSSRYSLLVMEGEHGSFPCGLFPITSKSFEIPYYFTSEKYYQLNVVDNYDYKKTIVTRTFMMPSSSSHTVDVNVSRDLYVTYNGDDTNTGTSKEYGLKTLTKAYEMINAKVNGDTENIYNIYIVPDPTVRNTPLTPEPVLMSGLGSITVDTPIKLHISGELPRNSDYDIASMLPWIKVEHTDKLITINNEKAEVTLDLSIIDVPGDPPSSLPPIPPLFDIKNGKLIIGKTVGFQYMPALTDPNLFSKQVKLLADVGSGTAQSSITFSSGNYFGENDSDMLTFVKVYSNGCIKVPSTYLDGIEDTGRKEIFIDSSQIVGRSNPIVQCIDSPSLTSDIARQFELYNPDTMKQIYDKYLTTEGVFADMKSFIYNLTNLPVLQGTSFVDLGSFQIKMTENGRAIFSDQQITQDTNNTYPDKLRPGYNYEITIIAEYHDSNFGQMRVNIAHKDFVFDSSAPLDIPLFNIVVNDPGTSSKGNEITSAVSEMCTLVNSMKTEQAITEPVNFVVNIDGQNYKESSSDIGSGVDMNAGIPLPDDMHLTVRGKDIKQKSKISLTENKLVTNSVNVTETNFITFENIIFETNISDPDPSSPSNVIPPLFDISRGIWKFNNIQVINKATTTSSLVFINAIPAGNVQVEGEFNIDPFIIKLNKDIGEIDGIRCAAIKLEGQITTTDNKPITISVYNADGIEEYTGEPTVLKAGENGALDAQHTKFVPNDPGYEINNMGQVVSKASAQP